MQMDFYTIIYLVTNLFSLVPIQKFMQIFFEKRRTPLWAIIASYTSYFIITSAVYLMIDIPILTLSINLIILFGITLNYQARLQKQILSSLYILIFMFVPEILIGVLTGYFQFSFFEVGNYTNVFGVVVVRLLTYLEAIVLRHFKGIRNNEPVGKVVWFSLIFIPLTTLFLRLFVLENEDLSQVKAALSVILILALNLTAFWFYDALALSYQKAMRSDKLELESKMYQKECALMKTSSEDMRQFRHDMKHQFSAMTTLLETGAYDKLKDQLESLTDKMNQRVTFSTTGNLAVDSIVNYKLQKIVGQDVEIETEIAVPEELSIEVADVVSLIGNLLDNALQALEYVSQEKYLYLKIMYSEGRLLIRVRNRHANQVQYENGEIVTTKSNRNEHGFGLKSIRAVAEHYQGLVKVEHDKTYFTTDVLLYL